MYFLHRLATVDEEAGLNNVEAIDLRNLRRKKREVGSEGDNCSESSSKRKSQRLSYVGSEINIIPNPRVSDVLLPAAKPRRSRRWESPSGKKSRIEYFKHLICMVAMVTRHPEYKS